MDSLSRNKSGKASTLFFLLLLALLFCGAGYVWLIYFENEAPEISLNGIADYLGKEAVISLSASDQNTGLKSIILEIEQKGKIHTLTDQKFIRSGYSNPMGKTSYSEKIIFNLKASGLKDGEFLIRLTAKDYSLRGGFSGNETVIEKRGVIDSIPPRVKLLHAERYIQPGGSGIVIYQIDDGAVKHGAHFGGHFHKGHLIGDGRDTTYIAYLGLPYNRTEVQNSKIVAVDSAGNEATVPFSPVVKKAVFKKDTINVGGAFLGDKIPEFEKRYPQMTGNNQKKYLYVNRKVREENNKKIFTLCQNTAGERFWKGRFLRMAGASKAGFADQRTYYYQGAEIDKQVHLGVDIASVRHAEIKAANSGVVVFADYLGIYGYMILLDHGQGVFSLYSHLSQIQAAVGDVVDQGQVMALSGKTGMAGGDHLHFSMVVNGVFVNPKEWWDPQWIEVTIDGPLADSTFKD